MTDSDKKDDERRDEALKRALRTPPKPHKKERTDGEKNSESK